MKRKKIFIILGILVIILITLILLTQKAKESKVTENQKIKENSLLDKKFEKVSFTKPAPYRFNDKWGFINPDGSFLISPQYEEVKPYDINNLALFRVDEQWGILNIEGKEIVKPQFNRAPRISEINYQPEDKTNILLSVFNSDENNNQYILFDPVTYEQEVLPGRPTSFSHEECSNRLVITYPTDWSQFYKEEIFYKNLLPIYEKYASFQKEGEYGIIDCNGNTIIEPAYERIEHVVNSYYSYTEDNKKGLIDIEGNIVTENIYDEISKIYNHETNIINIQGFKYNKQGYIIVSEKIDILTDYQEKFETKQAGKDDYGIKLSGNWSNNLIKEDGSLIYDMVKFRASYAIPTLFKEEGGDFYKNEDDLDYTNKLKGVKHLQLKRSGEINIINATAEFNSGFRDSPFGYIDNEGNELFEGVFTLDPYIQKQIIPFEDRTQIEVVDGKPVVPDVLRKDEAIKYIDDIKRQNVFITYINDGESDIHLCNTLEYLNCSEGLESFTFANTGFGIGRPYQGNFLLNEQDILNTTSGKKLLSVFPSAGEVSTFGTLGVWDLGENNEVSISSVHDLGRRSEVLDIRKLGKDIFITMMGGGGDEGYWWNEISVLKFEETFTEPFSIEFTSEGGSEGECTNQTLIEYEWNEEGDLVVNKTLQEYSDFCEFISESKLGETTIYKYR